jgi:SEC-C motif
MTLMIPEVFVPTADSKAVQRLRRRLGTERQAVKVSVSIESDAKDRDCFSNVRRKMEREGGRMQLGWALWQHADLFVEAEPHAVFESGTDQTWVDCTPHELLGGVQCREILFIPDDTSSYDINTTTVSDNVRVSLVDDPRVSEALRLFSEKTKLMNSVPGIDLPLPEDVAVGVAKLEFRAFSLLSEAMNPVAESRTKQKIGRNDACPCGSGKKFKRCHGL